MAIADQIPMVEDIFQQWKAVIGPDYVAYKNHVYRMINFSFSLHDCSGEEREKIVIAGCFHDLGIWTSKTFDYLPPSIALADAYLKEHGLEHWMPEIALMIDQHHKLRKHQDNRYPLVEVFRRGDLVDFSLGIVKFGLPKSYLESVRSRFPNAGFHKRLVQLEARWFTRHPLRPLPVLKW